MKRVWILLVLIMSYHLAADDLWGRGGRGGGGGGFRGGGGGYRGGGGGYRGGGGIPGGGYSRPSYGRTPSMSRPSPRPVTPVSRPGGNRPNVSRPSISPPRVSQPIAGSRPGVGSRPGPGVRPGTGVSPRPGTGVATRPSTGQLQNFLDMGPRDGAATRPGSRPSQLPGAIAGGIAGGAAAEFLQNSGPRPETRPAQRLGVGADRPGIAERPGIADRPGVGDRPALSDRPGIGQLPSTADRPQLADRPLAGNRPDRIENRQEWRNNRSERGDAIRDEFHDNHPRFDFWADHPNWARWRINHPYRWATWASMASWLPYGWAEPYYYAYGENVYYDEGQVYYGDEPIATADEYAMQADAILEAAPEVAPEQTEWMPLGVFALTPDGQAAGPDPTFFLQLMISKEGVINGTLHNSATGTTQDIEGFADKATQRCAWNVVGKSRPMMETGIANLTEDTSPTLVHFADGQTQQWLMVRLEEPAAQ